MARIKLSAFISDISGKVGGNVFQRSLSGIIIKNKSGISFKNSELQSLSNNYMYRCQYEWQQLTACQRQIWNSFAKYSKKQQKHSKEIFINGHQLFIQCNYYRFQYGYNTLREPQFVKGNLKPMTCNVEIFSTNLHIRLSRVPVPAYEFIILQATTRVSPTLNNPGSRYKTLIFNTIGSTLYSIKEPYKDIFGFKPIANDVIYIKYSLANRLNGLIEPFQTKRVIL